PASQVSVMTGADAQVYASEDSIYVFTQKSAVRNPDGSIDYSLAYSNPQTEVWKFDFDRETHTVELAATGEFSGTLLNQFAADEHDGYLRLVTRSSAWGNGADGQNVIVMQETNGELNVVGSVMKIAEGESLYSVRFLGDHVFFVTFRQIDPLFV